MKDIVCASGGHVERLVPRRLCNLPLETLFTHQERGRERERRVKRSMRSDRTKFTCKSRTQESRREGERGRGVAVRSRVGEAPKAKRVQGNKRNEIDS